MFKIFIKNCNRKTIWVIITLVLSVTLIGSTVHAFTVGTTVSKPSGSSLTNGLVGHWTFDGKNMVNNVADSSGQGNNGSLKNVVATSSIVVAGKLGQALSFDGTNDHVDVGSTATLDFPDVSFSYSFWVFTNTVQARNVISNRATDSSASKGYSVYFSNGAASARLEMRFIDGTDHAYAIIGAMKYNQWHHVAVVWDRESATVTAYTDGVQTLVPTSIVGIGSIPKSSTFKIAYGEKGYFKGAVDDVRIYNRVISATEIKQLYNSGSTNKISSTISRPAGSSLLSGLVGHWTFDGKNMVSNVADLSGQGNNGSLKNVVATSSIVVAGKLGQALSFDGVNDYANVGDPVSGILDAGTGDFSMSVWVRGNTWKDSIEMILAKGSSGAALDSAGYRLLFQSSGTYIRLELHDGTNFISRKYGSNYFDDKWHHIAVSWQRSTEPVVYVDGVVNTCDSDCGGTAASSLGNLNNSDALTIGSRSDGGGGYLSGQVDDARIYNRSLSASEIKQLYSQGSAKVASTISRPDGSSLLSGLVGHWTFDGKNLVSNVADSSGQGNNGMMSGFTSTSSAVTAGKMGQALRFDGGDDYINLQNPASLIFSSNSSFTLSVWVKTTSTADQRIVYRYFSGQDIIGLVNNTCVANKASFNIRDANAAGYKCVSSTTNTNDGKWHHIVGVRNVSTDLIYIFVDGVMENSTSDDTTSGFNGANNLWTIGRAATAASNYFSGSVDDVRIYSRALSNSEILQLYNIGK